METPVRKIWNYPEVELSFIIPARAPRTMTFPHNPQVVVNKPPLNQLPVRSHTRNYRSPAGEFPPPAYGCG